MELTKQYSVQQNDTGATIELAAVTALLYLLMSVPLAHLAALQDVPRSLYEAADIDGATARVKLRHVTISMISPVIYFNVIMGIIGSLQTFTQAFIMTGPDGPPARSTLFYALYLFTTAFYDLRMGYASAMAWILFLIIVSLTVLASKWFENRVHYGR